MVIKRVPAEDVKFFRCSGCKYVFEDLRRRPKLIPTPTTSTESISSWTSNIYKSETETISPEPEKQNDVWMNESFEP